jgi:protein gp37
MDKSKIEWTDATWNPVTGCTKVSEGCRNCYAERIARRFPRGGIDPEFSKSDVVDDFRVMLHPARLEEPFHWRKPRRIFVCSMGDLFHGDVPPAFILSVLSVISLSPRHTFMVLTKRPDRMCLFLSAFGGNKNARDKISDKAFDLWGEEADCQAANAIEGCLGEGFNVGWPMRNLWLGVSAEDQAAADERIPLLLATPAAVRFVSVEPMLGPVDLDGDPYNGPGWIRGWRVELKHGSTCDGFCISGECPVPVQVQNPYLDWVICGGESGPGARPMHPVWARSLRDQCQAAGVPYFFKQWGEWGYHQGAAHTDSMDPFRVGKKKAGRILDGRTWDEIPEVRS